MDGKLMKTAIAAALVAAFCCSAALATAQSLADVAKKEEARRSAVRAASKTLTNADLGADPRDKTAVGADKAPVATMVAPVSTAAAVPGNASPDGQVAQPPEAAAKEKDDVPPEAWWRTRAQSMRARIVQARKNVDELTVAPSEDERQQAKVAKLLKSAQEALARCEQDLKNLEMHADVSGVPKTWIK